MKEILNNILLRKFAVLSSFFEIYLLIITISLHSLIFCESPVTMFHGGNQA